MFWTFWDKVNHHESSIYFVLWFLGHTVVNSCFVTSNNTLNIIVCILNVLHQNCLAIQWQNCVLLLSGAQENSWLHSSMNLSWYKKCWWCKNSLQLTAYIKKMTRPYNNTKLIKLMMNNVNKFHNQVTDLNLNFHSTIYAVFCMLGKIFNRQDTEIFLLFFPEYRVWHFMQIVSNEDYLHEMPNPVFGKDILNCCMLKFLPSMLSINIILHFSLYNITSCLTR